MTFFGLDFDTLLKVVSSRVFTLKEKEKIYENVRKDIKWLEDLEKNAEEHSDWVQSTAEADRMREIATNKAVLEALLRKWIRNLDGQNSKQRIKI